MASLPASLLQGLHQLPAFDEAAFMQAHGQPPVTSVRLHPVKKTGAFDSEEHVPWCDEGRYLSSRPVFTLDPLFHAGAYYVQEASSMFLHHMVRSLFPERNDLRVLDLCAAPGGKSTLLASLLGSQSLLISNEVIRSRASILEENVTRWGYMNNWVTSNDAKDFAKLRGYFDLIVVDAPCSGSGLFRKDEKALDEWRESNVQLCAERQQRILADIWPALKEDGILLYATCSYSATEDEHILDWLASTFNVESLSVPLPEEWGIVNSVSAQHQLTGYRFFPDKLKGEGFFIAALRKKDVEEQPRMPKFKTAHNKKTHGQAAAFLNPVDWVCLQDKNGVNFAVAAGHEKELQQLSACLYFRRTGIALGIPSTKEWIPEHDLALSVDCSADIPAIELDKAQALHYLKKEDINVQGIVKGWQLVKYNGLPLGWVKNTGTRINNYLPKHWRIRMDISSADWE